MAEFPEYAHLYDRSKSPKPFEGERPPYVMGNLHLLKGSKQSGLTFATAYMNSRDPEYMRNERRPQNLDLLRSKRPDGTFGRTVLMHEERFRLEDGAATDSTDSMPPLETLPAPGDAEEGDGAALAQPPPAADDGSDDQE